MYKGVYIFCSLKKQKFSFELFVIFANIDCRYTLELPYGVSCNEYPSMV